MKIVWTTLIALGSSATVLFLLLVVAAGAITYYATHPPRRRFKRTPAVFGADFEEVEFPSRDGVMLSGWFVPPPAGATRHGAVILCHGMMANRTEELPWAAPLWAEGFALLMFDFRAVGKSGGELCTAGHFETQDLHGAVDYLEAREDTADLPIGVFGFSMGGAAAIMAAAEDTRLRAVATHGAYATLDRAIKQRCRHHFGPLAPIAEWVTHTLGEWLNWFPIPPSSVSPMEVVSRITPRPLLLLHGKRDRIIRASDARDLHAAASDPKELHILPRSSHKRIHRTLRDEAKERVTAFFCETLHPTKPNEMESEASEPQSEAPSAAPARAASRPVNAKPIGKPHVPQRSP